MSYEDVPLDAQLFYDDFGHLHHSKTGQEIQYLAPYQIRFWEDKSKYRLGIKSQKIGLSTSCLLEDLQKALTTCKGKDILLIAQTQDQANEHLHTLKTLIINSEKYRKYLVTESSDMPFKEEKTKLSEVHIKNPDNPHKITRIIGKGPSEAGLWSWKNVAHIHMSDIAANKLRDDSSVFAAAFSRLATTDGTMLIETPPRGPFKKTFEIYQQSLVKSEDVKIQESQFSIHHISAQEAVSAGVISQSFLDAERLRLGPTAYAQNYECEFVAATGNLFTQLSIDRAIRYEYDPDNFNPNSEKYIIADLGYVTSKFAILIAEFVPKIKKVRILLAEEIESPSYEKMINRILLYRKKYGNVQNIGIDATSRMEFAMSLKTKIGESDSIPHVKKIMEECKTKGYDIAKRMLIVPIIFSTESKNFMSSHARRVLDDPRDLIAINPKFVNLITGLRSAVFDDRGMLDKDMTPHDDIVDCFMMVCQFFKFEKR